MAALMTERMCKFIFSALLVLLSFIGKGQTVDGKLYTIFNNWYQWSGGKFNTNLNIPKVIATTGRDTGGIRYSLADSSMYVWTGSQWRAVGSSLDTSSLSNRINQRVKYTDTAAMLSPYLRSVNVTTPTLQQVTTAGNSITNGGTFMSFINDETLYEIGNLQSGGGDVIFVTGLGINDRTTYRNGSFQRDFNGKQNINFLPDSTGYITQRIKVNGNTYDASNKGTIDLGTISTDTSSLSNRINERVKYTDTAAMLSHYLRKIDTTNAFLISVSQPNDSTLRFAKGATQTDYIIRSAVAGSATRLTTTVYNNSGATILKGAVVYINGRHSSNLPTIALAQANNEANSYTTFALVETDIANGSAGLVIQVGNIGNLNLPTSTYSDGQVLYLSPTVPGGYTTTKPLAPNHITKIGTVTRAHPTLGSIQIKIENGWQLDELSDVQIAAIPNDSTILQFSRVDSLWKAVDPTTAMGNRFVRRTDSAAMLAPYLRSNVAAATYQLQLDTVPLAVFGAGSGAAGDTAAFSTSAVYGSFYNAGSDTLIITQMRAGVLGTSPSITTEVYWNDSLNVIGGGATLLVTGGTSVTGTIGATNVTSFTNNKIPPNVWVFVRTSALATKPTYFTLTLLGYKKRI
jgi:hypothetical protein